MKVVDRKPVPIYEAECSECHSKIEYRASEVSYTGYITCPVCGSSVWGCNCHIVRMDTEQTILELSNLLSEKDKIIKELSLIRTDIEAEPKHGRWEVGYESHGDAVHRCSLCGHTIATHEDSNYCPNCGAKMDEVKE